MALVIENGSNVAGANSYVTVAEYTAWADARFGSRSTAPGCDADAEALILRAMDYFESQRFIGRKNEESQPLQWPRAWVTIDGFAVEANEIPKEVKASIYELAYAEEVGESQLASIERKAIKEKVGPIEVTYSGSFPGRAVNLAAPMAMRKLLAVTGGLVVSRA